MYETYRIESLLMHFKQSSAVTPATPGLHPDDVSVSNAASDSECESCDNLSQSNHSMRIHDLEPHTKSSFYTCTLCENFFHSFPELAQHFENVHAITNIVACGICQQVFLNSTEVGYHVAAMHGGQAPISCDPIPLNNHIDDQHSCGSCREVFFSRRDLNLHTTLHHNNDGLLFLQPSDLCIEIPLVNQTPRNRASTNIISDLLLCMFCDHTPETESQLKEHICPVHGPVSPQNCEERDGSYTYNNDENVHHNQGIDNNQTVCIK